MYNIHSGIYLLYSISSGYYYIGKTNNFSKRKTSHFILLKNNEHYNIHLQNIYNKYNDLYFEPIIFIKNTLKENLDELLTLQEQLLLDNFFKHEYCLNKDPISGFSGMSILTQEELEERNKKLSKSIKDKWKDPLYRETNLKARNGRFFADILTPDGEILRNVQRKDLAKHYGRDSTCWSDLITGRKNKCFKYTKLS